MHRRAYKIARKVVEPARARSAIFNGGSANAAFLRSPANFHCINGRCAERETTITSESGEFSERIPFVDNSGVFLAELSFRRSIAKWTVVPLEKNVPGRRKGETY